MRHENSVFHQISKLIPWETFETSVAHHQGDHRVRTCRMKDQFLALLFGQLGGVSSLRGTTEGLASQSARLYHLGTRPLARSTLSDANRTRPFEVYRDVFAALVGEASRRHRRHLSEAVRLIDATKVSLSGTGSEWAHITSDHRGVKLHIVYDPLGDIPVEAEITHDMVPVKAFNIEPGMTYVFDMAYYSYAYWARLNAAGCRFVTRVKRHTTITPISDLPVSEGDNILGDTIGHLPARLAASRRNPFQDPVREIIVRRADGRPMRLVTNDLDTPATQIADLYKLRWQIELLFRWLKQNLKIRRLIGRNENAVKIQLYVALIAYLLLRAAQALQTAVAKQISFARLIQQNLMRRRPITELAAPPQKPPNSKCPETLDLKLCLTGQ